MENLKANRRRTPEHPPEDSRDDPVAWYEFFEEKMMLEDALIRIPEVEGFSEEAMQEAWEAYEQQSDRIKEEVIRLVESHKRSRLRERYFSRENPEAFLAVDDLPDPDDADENERAGSSASSPFAGFPSPDPPSEFLHSLPKLTAWGQSRHPSNSNSGSSDESSGWKQFPAVNDSIEQNVREYFEFVSDQLTEDRESWPPVYHYIHLLSMKPRVHIAASHAFVEDSTLNPAPVYGAYLHAIHCLRRIREAIDTLGRTELATIRNRTTDVIRDIERELD